MATSSVMTWMLNLYQSKALSGSMTWTFTIALWHMKKSAAVRLKSSSTRPSGRHWHTDLMSILGTNSISRTFDKRLSNTKKHMYSELRQKVRTWSSIGNLETQARKSWICSWLPCLTAREKRRQALWSKTFTWQRPSTTMKRHPWSFGIRLIWNCRCPIFVCHSKSMERTWRLTMVTPFHTASLSNSQQCSSVRCWKLNSHMSTLCQPRSIRSSLRRRIFRKF